MFFQWILIFFFHLSGILFPCMKEKKEKLLDRSLDISKVSFTAFLFPV